MADAPGCPLWSGPDSVGNQIVQSAAAKVVGRPSLYGPGYWHAGVSLRLGHFEAKQASALPIKMGVEFHSWNGHRSKTHAQGQGNSNSFLPSENYLLDLSRNKLKVVKRNIDFMVPMR